MLDLTTCLSEEINGRYDLSELPEGDFWKALQASKHVLYDWGYDWLYVSSQPFTVKYPEGLVDSGSREEGDWFILESLEDFRDAMRDKLTGEPGWSVADFISSLLRSGLKVDLTGCENYGPKDPVAFMEHLRSSVGT